MPKTNTKTKNNKKETQKSTANVNYTVGDFLLRLKNGAIARHKKIEVGNSKLVRAVSEVLKKEGFVEKLEEKDGKTWVTLAFRKKEPVLIDVKLVSKPGLRIYMAADEIAKRRGASVLVLSTSRGVMSGKQALKERVGGEAIAEIL